jgi:hypothetical protein
MTEEKSVYNLVYESMIECCADVGPSRTLTEFKTRVEELYGSDQYNESVLAISDFERDYPIH